MGAANRTEEVLEGLFAGAPAGLGFWDAELRFRRVNPRLAEINGMPAADHIGRTPTELLGNVGAAAEREMRRVLETGDAAVEMQFSGELPAKPGRTGFYVASFFPVTDGIGGVVLDVTDREHAARREHEALEEAEAARSRAEALARASTALASSMRTDRVLTELVEAAVPSLADFCAVYVVRPDGRLEPVAVAIADPADEELAHRLAARSVHDPTAPVGPAAVARTGRAEINPVLTPEGLDRDVADDEERGLLKALGIQSAAVLPLTARGAVLGSLTMAMGHSGRRYESHLAELVESLGAGAGLALDNARLFAEQVEVARALQSTLLPSELPHVPGVELAARYRAAGRSNQVGGDFYDVFAATEGEWALVIGDVVGKGAEAAAITSLVRATLQAAVMRGDGPEDALRLVDEALRRRSGVQFCSALHGRLRPGPDGVAVQLLAAGHPPPLVLRAGVGTVEVVEVSGTLLGVTPQPSFGETRLHLAPGDALVLYTDGATELRGADRWRGEAALHETLLASAGVPLPQLVERLEHEALVLSGGELRDDLALLAIGAVPPGSE